LISNEIKEKEGYYKKQGFLYLKIQRESKDDECLFQEIKVEIDDVDSKIKFLSLRKDELY
jgi:hypothetical protein